MTDAAKQALGYVAQDDGIFFMDTESFWKYWEEITQVRLWDSSWSVCTASGYFFRGSKVATAVEARTAEAEDELELEVGDTIVLTDCQHPHWWAGRKQTSKRSFMSRWRRKGDDEDDPKQFPKECVRLADGVGGSRKYTLSAAGPTEAVIVLLQPDLNTTRSYSYSKELGQNEKDDSYSSIMLSVTDVSGEQVAVAEGEKRKVLVTVTLGSEPLTVSVADYGGAGEKFQVEADPHDTHVHHRAVHPHHIHIQLAVSRSLNGVKLREASQTLLCVCQLMVYSQASAKLVRMRGRSEASGDDEERLKQLFGYYDVNGNGALERDELYKVLLEMDVLEDLDPDAVTETIDEAFDDVDSEGVNFEDFRSFYEAVQNGDWA